MGFNDFQNIYLIRVGHFEQVKEDICKINFFQRLTSVPYIKNRPGFSFELILCPLAVSSTAEAL